MMLRRIFAVFVVSMLLLLPAVSVIPSSSANEYEKSETDVLFSRASVTYLDDVHYDEHKDRTECWFFIPGSERETAFRGYVTHTSSQVPSADDREELNNMSSPLCNMYSIDFQPRFTVNQPLVVTSAIEIHADKGDHIYIDISADYGDYMQIINKKDSSVQFWFLGNEYCSKASETTDYLAIPFNEALSGQSIDLNHLFVKVSYSVKVTAAAPSFGDNVYLVIVFFLIAAVLIVLIFFCSRKISWAKDAADPGTVDEEKAPEEEKKR